MCLTGIGPTKEYFSFVGLFMYLRYKDQRRQAVTTVANLG